MLISEQGILFNTASDIERAHQHQDLNNVMHIFDVFWHGIRSATACLPGHKIAISHKQAVSGDGIHHLYAYLHKHQVQHICYQGFSENALKLAELLQQEFGSKIQQYVITHVSSAQFENQFEMLMLNKMLAGLKSGLFKRLGSVKPRFSSTIPEFFPQTLINLAPKIIPNISLRELNRVLIPVENNWRKNLYTNVLAAVYSDAVQTINVVNWPNGIEDLVPSDKLEWIAFMRPSQMLSQAASSAAIMHASLIECQPMTQLEALAVGTPCINAKLGIHAEIEQHPLTKLCEVEFADDVGALSQTLTTVCQQWHTDPVGLQAMIKDHLTLRQSLSMQSYLDFIS